jgi:hypothetical protein
VRGRRAVLSFIEPTSAINELALLGGFAFSVGGEALLGISSGSQRLLAFLAVRDRMVTRTQVAGTLWPESSTLAPACVRLCHAWAVPPASRSR